MLSVHRSLVLGALFLLATLCCDSNASAIPRPEGLVERANPICSRVDVAVVVKVLGKFSAVGSQICTKILNLTPAKTVTTTAQQTVTNSVSVTTTSITTTALPGTTVTATVSQTTTVVVIDTATATSIVTTTSTGTTTAPLVTRTVTVDGAPTTTTTTVYSAANVYKKRAASYLRDVYPNCPKELGGILLDLAKNACGCFVSQSPPVTVTVTSTATAIQTVTVPVTSTSTVPGATVSSSVTVTETASTSTTVTVTDSSTATVPQIITVTPTSTATTTTQRTITSTRTVQVTYSNVPLPRQDCVYNRYYDYPDVNNDATNNYQTGVRQCQALCTNNPACKFWFFLKFDPNKARGFGGAACILDNQPYDPAFLQCNYVNSFNVAYNKNP